MEGITYNTSKISSIGKFDVTIEANFTDNSNVQNLTTFCPGDYVPSVEEYFKAFNIVGVVLFTLGGLAVTVTIILFADTLRHIVKKAPPSVKANSAFVLSVYPMVAISTYCAVIVPRAQLLAEAWTQGMFMACLYQLFCLFVAYSGGEAVMIENLKPKSLIMRVPPCCCYPCCKLPTLTVTKKHVLLLRLSVLQLPVVQGLVYMILLVMWADEGSLYNVNYMYFQPIIVASILFGVWGIIMTMRMLQETLKDYHIQGKYIVLQLVLLFAKFQGLVAKIVVWTGGISCTPPITASVYTNLVYNSVMLTEMVILGVFARLLYKKNLPSTPVLPTSRVLTTSPVIRSQIRVVSSEQSIKPSEFSENIETKPKFGFIRKFLNR